MQGCFRYCKLSRARWPRVKTCKTSQQLIPSEAEVISVLKQCSKTKDSVIGKHIHQTLGHHRVKLNTVLANTLIEMYRKFQCMQMATEVFEEMRCKNVVTWGCLMHGYVENGESVRVLELFSAIDCEPNHVIYVAVLKACSCIASASLADKQLYLEKGIAIHRSLKGTAAESSIVVSNTLIDMYGKFGETSLAGEVFERMSERDVVSWSCFMRTCVENGQSLAALELFKRMDCAPNHVTYTVALQACSALASERESVRRSALETGVDIHERVREQGMDSNIIISNTLVDMYSKHGYMIHAREVFDKMDTKDVISWTCLMLGYVENGEISVAFELLSVMDCQPNHVTFVVALKSCMGIASQGSSYKSFALQRGKQIHRLVVGTGCESHLVVSNTLIDMYCKCGEMALARKVFDSMKIRTAVSWTTLMQGYVENGQGWMALELLDRMDCPADHITYVVALKGCMSLATESDSQRERALKKGVEIHEEVARQRLYSNPVLANALMAMYWKCGELALAKNVFDWMGFKNVVSWNCLIQGYVEEGKYFEALALFRRMDCEPDHVTYVTALKACAGISSDRLEEGIRLHEQARRGGCASNIIVANALVDMYSRCGSMRLARDVFESMALKDVVTWNTFMQGYVENGESAVALELRNGMDVEPDHVTYVVLLRACGSLFSKNCSDRERIVDRGRVLHEDIKARGFDSSIVVSNTLIDMYSKFGKMRLAMGVFDEMDERDIVTWNCLISGFVDNGENAVALELFDSLEFVPDYITYAAALKACSCMASENESSRKLALEKGLELHSHVKRHGCESKLIVSNALVDMYTKCGCMKRAREVFERMEYKDIVTWTCLMLGYVENDQSSATLELFGALDCKPDCLAYVAVFKACGSLTLLAFGRSVHSKVCKLGLEVNAMIATTLVDFYCRCGCLSTAIEVFLTLQSPNIVTWNALLTGYSSLRDHSQVIGLASKIHEAGVHFDAITYVCILTACNHAGMLREGEMYFNLMQEHGIVPSVKHYTCMIDLLGRANKFEEALSLLGRMPLKASVVTWMALLDACKKWSNIEVAKIAFDAIVQSGDQSHSSAAHVLMHDIYAALK